MPRVCFFGDVHLGYGSRSEQRERTELLCTFLAHLPSYCSHVVILGDLFDFWFDYRSTIPKEFWQAVAALGALRRSGVEVDYIIGNHDFGHWRFFREELGIEPLSSDIERYWYGKRFYITHGDGKLPSDRGYRLLRSLLRSRVAQRLYRLLHPDIGIALARWASRASRLHAGVPPHHLVDNLESFAQALLAAGYDAVVAGHSHVPALKRFGAGWYVNPGGWLTDDPLFASFDGERIELLSVRAFIAAMGGNCSSSASSSTTRV